MDRHNDHSSDISGSNRLWYETLQNVLQSAAGRNDTNHHGSDDLNMIRWLYTVVDNDIHKPPQSFGADESFATETGIELTAQFNQLASVHNLRTINEAAGIIRDILSA